MNRTHVTRPGALPKKKKVKTEGFGFMADTVYHFRVYVPAKGDITIVEFTNGQEIKARITRDAWLLIADEVKAEFNRRLRDLDLKSGAWKPDTPLDKLLGKELTLLAWAIEGATPDQIDFAVRNWCGLRPEERWWLYTTTNATSNLPFFGPERGWRKAMRIAFTDNPVELKY